MSEHTAENAPTRRVGPCPKPTDEQRATIMRAIKAARERRPIPPAEPATNGEPR